MSPRTMSFSCIHSSPFPLRREWRESGERFLEVATVPGSLPPIMYPDLGICGLSCRLCPRYYTDGSSRCHGCKTPSRMEAGCPFITCALRRQQVEFCVCCEDADHCARWQRHRSTGLERDSFVSYQSLERDIAYVQEHGIAAFSSIQEYRASLLRVLLEEFNDGRSKTLFCIAASVMGAEELDQVIRTVHGHSEGLSKQEKALLMRSQLMEIAKDRGYCLRLRQ